jgi:hypothetical protein
MGHAKNKKENWAGFRKAGPENRVGHMIFEKGDRYGV